MRPDFTSFLTLPDFRPLYCSSCSGKEKKLREIHSKRHNKERQNFFDGGLWFKDSSSAYQKFLQTPPQSDNLPIQYSFLPTLLNLDRATSWPNRFSYLLWLPTIFPHKIYSNKSLAHLIPSCNLFHRVTNTNDIGSKKYHCGESETETSKTLLPLSTIKVNQKKYYSLGWIEFGAFIHDLKDVEMMILSYLNIINQSGLYTNLMYP